MYLVEALKHDVPAFHEDRLTQIIAASFNASGKFKKCLLSFLKVKSDVLNLVARTQVVGENSRPDLVIYKQDLPFICIESKVSAASIADQQFHHLKLKCPYNFLLCRDPVLDLKKNKRFNRVTYYDFFNHLRTDLKKINDILDKFIFEQILNYGKECNMLVPDSILKSDLESAANFFTQTRLRKSPSIGFTGRTPFKALDDISLFFERVLHRLKEDTFFYKKTKGFVKKVKLSSLYSPSIVQEMKDKKIPMDFAINTKINPITIEKEIELKKNFNGFNRIFLRLEFNPMFRGEYVENLSVEKICSIDINRIEFMPEIFAGLSASSTNFDYDDCVCFDDADLRSFTKFYSEAVKHWKKNLS